MLTLKTHSREPTKRALNRGNVFFHPGFACVGELLLSTKDSKQMANKLMERDLVPLALRQAPHHSVRVKKDNIAFLF